MKFADPYVQMTLGHDAERAGGWLYVRGQFPAKGSMPAYSAFGGAVTPAPGESLNGLRFGHEGNGDLFIQGEVVIRPILILSTAEFAGHRIDQMLTESNDIDLLLEKGAKIVLDRR